METYCIFIENAYYQYGTTAVSAWVSALIFRLVVKHWKIFEILLELPTEIVKKDIPNKNN